MSSVYHINKGINKEIEFKGFRAQYIWYLGGLLIALMFVFTILYITGLHPVFCIVIVGVAGVYGVTKIYRLSNRYGKYGMMKHLASRSIPKALRCNSRKIFFFGKREHPT